MIVCADDYGMAPDINDAIVDLAARGRLSAVSCMVLPGMCSAADLQRLLALDPRLDLGLHLTLTNDGTLLAPAAEVPSLLRHDGRPHAFGGLLRACLRRHVRAAEVQREVALQVARFTALAGRPPDYVDGHLHVQQFPGIRAGVLAWLRSLPAEPRPYVRNSAMAWGKIQRQGVSRLKCAALAAYGRAFRRLLGHEHRRTNHGFAGVYDYRQFAHYPAYLQRFVAHMEDPSGILMVHPGTVEAWRCAEYDALRTTTLLDGRVNRFPG